MLGNSLTVKESATRGHSRGSMRASKLQKTEHDLLQREGLVQLRKFVDMKGVRPSKLDMRQLKLVKELDARSAANKEQHTNRTALKREARLDIQ